MNFTNEDKTVAILSYITIAGFIVSLFLHTNKKTHIGAYHLRQALGLLLTTFSLWAITRIVAWIPILGGLVDIAIYIVSIFFIIMGALSAAKGEYKPLPYIGKFSERIFSSLF